MRANHFCTHSPPRTNSNLSVGEGLAPPVSLPLHFMKNLLYTPVARKVARNARRMRTIELKTSTSSASFLGTFLRGEG